MIAATIGGPIITERKIPLSMSLKNNHGVCCIIEDKNVRKPVEMKILSSGVVFTFEEGISTSHVCLKGQQPIF